MKNYYFVLLMVLLALAGCTQRPMLNEGADSSFSKYYAYNPEDTTGNYPFLEMLRIDSARVEYLMDHPISQLSSIDLGGLNGEEKTHEQRLQDDIKVHAEAEAKWYEMLRLCSQRQYEELLSMYIKEETNIGIALATSTNKFELDYLVIGLLLFDQLEEEEAAEIFVKFLEYDKFLTESVVLFGESQLGYVPPQYAFQLEILCRIYLIMEDREKAEALIEPYRKAIYLLSDDVPWNESMIARFKSNIYEEFGDLDGVIETAIGYRDFLIQYAKDNDEDYDDLIREIDSLVRKWEMNK